MTKNYPNGDYYEGFYEDNMKSGNGTLRFSEISSYVYFVGYFKNDAKHGHGQQVWKDGTIYDGEWKKNKRHGIGNESYANGASYEGYFENDKKSGNGSTKKIVVLNIMLENSKMITNMVMGSRFGETVKHMTENGRTT